MSKSKRKGRHYMDDELSLYKSIRKPIPKPSKAMSSKKDTRKKRFDWWDELSDEV